MAVSIHGLKDAKRIRDFHDLQHVKACSGGNLDGSGLEDALRSQAC